MAAQFTPLPCPDNAEGQPRKIGVEIEFIGLGAAEAASLLQEECGGTLDEEGAHKFILRGSRIGDVSVTLDMAAAHGGGEEGLEPKLRELIGDAASIVTPVEFVFPPLTLEALPVLGRVVVRLRASDAQGTEGSPFYGFGVHFNVEVREMSVEGILPVLRAFALLEDWIRGARRPDLSRRALPFVDPFPRGYLDLLAEEGQADSLEQMQSDYLEFSPTRNRSLDMLPILATIDRDAVESAVGDAKLSARPAYHYRLPDSRVGDPGWSLAEEWRVWALIERVASDEALLATLSEAWREHRASWTTIRTGWAETVEDILATRGLGRQRIVREDASA